MHIVTILALLAAFCPIGTLHAQRTSTKTREFPEGGKLVDTVYSEGKLAGKRKKSERFDKDGKLDMLAKHDYDNKGNLTELYAEAFANGGSLLQYIFISADDNVQQQVRYNDGILDVSKGLAFPSNLKPFPESSGYRTKNADLSLSLSPDGKSVVVTLKNVSGSPIEVHEEVLMAPLIYVSWRDNDNKLNSGIVNKCQESQKDKTPRATSLAPGASLRCEKPLKEVFDPANAFTPSWVSKVEPQAELRVRVVYENLFPLPPDTKSAKTTIAPFGTSIGKFDALKAKMGQ